MTQADLILRKARRELRGHDDLAVYDDGSALTAAARLVLEHTRPGRVALLAPGTAPGKHTVVVPTSVEHEANRVLAALLRRTPLRTAPSGHIRLFTTLTNEEYKDLAAHAQVLLQPLPSPVLLNRLQQYPEVVHGAAKSAAYLAKSLEKKP